VAFPGAGRLSTAIYARDKLARDQVIEGPAIVAEWTTTIVVPPAWSARVDGLGDLLLERS
jgi:N-methylhydantoinase A/oxoprolinase/acetone carboxylase beta subunit